jgi:putative aldouronate transport system substrate-binding protein
MKKANLKRLIALAAACVMTLSVLAGCKKADGPTSDPKPGTEVKGPAGMEGWEAFENRVKITVPVYDRSREGFPAVDDNYWTKWVQSEFGEKWNVDVEFVAIPRGDVMTKYSLLIAAGQTPTILMEYDYPKVTQWANEGAMAVINLEDFAHVAPTYYEKMVDNNQLQYTKVNGKDYFVLSERPYYDAGYTYVGFMRKDWLDKIGMDVPKSYEETLKVLDAIKAAGLTDHPIGMSLPTNSFVLNHGFRDFPVNEEEWAMHSSLGTASLPWEPTRRLLKRQNAEFNKGYISPEFDLDADGSQMKTDFINGKLFSYGGYMGANVDWLTAFFEQNPDAELTIGSIYGGVEPGVLDKPQVRTDNPFGMIVGFSSRATKEQLTAAWMYMEWMSQPDVLFTLENGIEGVTYTLNEDGFPVVDGNYRGPEMLNHNMNIDMTCIVHASKQLPTVEDSIKAITPQGIPQDLYALLLQNYKNNREIADKGWAVPDPIFAVSLESESEYTATLRSLWQEYNVRLTKCSPEEFDALYEDFSKKFLEAGYQEIMDERLEAFKAGQTTRLPKK